MFGAGFVANFPHGFVVLAGTPDDGSPAVDGDFGFSAGRPRRARDPQPQVRRGLSAGGEHLPAAFLQPQSGVFQGEVEHRSLLHRDGAECRFAEGDGRGEAEGQPGFAELGCAGEDVEPFGDQAGYGPPGWWELGGDQFGVGPLDAALLAWLRDSVQWAGGAGGHAATALGRLAPLRRPEAMVSSACRSL